MLLYLMLIKKFRANDILFHALLSVIIRKTWWYIRRHEEFGVQSGDLNAQSCRAKRQESQALTFSCCICLSSHWSHSTFPKTIFKLCVKFLHIQNLSFWDKKASLIIFTIPLVICIKACCLEFPNLKKESYSSFIH